MTAALVRTPKMALAAARRERVVFIVSIILGNEWIKERVVNKD